MEFDVIVRHGSVFDGTGAAPVAADVGLAGDRIIAVADLAHATANIEIDASGLAVSPGFIDVHTHSDLVCFLGDEHRDVAAGNVRQGVTTEITGNCGFSPFPYLSGHRADLERHLEPLLGSCSLPWHDLAGYREQVREAGLYSNAAPCIGHGSVRAGVMGFENRAPGDDEMKAMVRLVEEGFEQGAVGVSSGLVYSPGVYARADELVALCRAVARYRRPYITHMRGETDMVADSVREAITTSRAAGVPLHISHHKVAGKANWGRTEETLGIIEAARRDGHDLTLDVYPYTASSTLLYGLLPPWVQEGGVPAMLERLAQPRIRERIRQDFEAGLPGWQNTMRAAGWAGIYISSCPGQIDAEGKGIVELTDNAGTTPSDYVFDLLVAQNARVTMITHTMSEADVRRVLSYDASMIGSDGIPLPGKPHPRWAGSFARVLGRYTRDEHLLGLAKSVHKATGMAAARFGLSDRGQLANGKLADVVVFDPATILDRATYDSPLLHPTGVREVLVNGQFAVRDTELTGRRSGRLLEMAAG